MYLKNNYRSCNNNVLCLHFTGQFSDRFRYHKQLVTIMQFFYFNYFLIVILNTQDKNILYISNSFTINEIGKTQFEDTTRKAQDFKGSCDTLNSSDSNCINNR